MKPAGSIGDKPETHDDVLRFVSKLISFRKAHPSICRSRFWREDVKWYGTDHLVDLSKDASHIAYCLHGESHNDNDLYVMINGSDHPTRFGIQEGTPGTWRRVVDTSRCSPDDIVENDNAKIIHDSFLKVEGNSIVVLLRHFTRSIER